MISTQKLQYSKWRHLKSDNVYKAPKFVKKNVSLGPECTLQKQASSFLAKIEQRRMPQCSSCCTVGRVCNMIDSSDSSATLFPHRICSLHFAVSGSESLPLVTFILKRYWHNAQTGALNLFSNTLLCNWLAASVATSALLNPRCAIRHSKRITSAHMQLKRMDDPEFQSGALRSCVWLSIGSDPDRTPLKRSSALQGCAVS